VTHAGTTPATTLHAYSPPLTAMSYYAVEPGPRLRRTRTMIRLSIELPRKSGERRMRAIVSTAVDHGDKLT